MRDASTLTVLQFSIKNVQWPSLPSILQLEGSSVDIMRFRFVFFYEGQHQVRNQLGTPRGGDFWEGGDFASITYTKTTVMHTIFFQGGKLPLIYGPGEQTS